MACPAPQTTTTATVAPSQFEMKISANKAIYQNGDVNGSGLVSETEDITAKAAAAHLDQFYKVIEQPLGQRRNIRIACMGAGYSGLMMAITFRQRLEGKNAEFVIYERNEDLGGTWLENRSAFSTSVFFSFSCSFRRRNRPAHSNTCK